MFSAFIQKNAAYLIEIEVLKTQDGGHFVGGQLKLDCCFLSMVSFTLSRLRVYISYLKRFL